MIISCTMSHAPSRFIDASGRCGVTGVEELALQGDGGADIGDVVGVRGCRGAQAQGRRQKKGGLGRPIRDRPVTVHLPAPSMFTRVAKISC